MKAVLVTVAMALAACGGSEGGGTSTTSPPTSTTLAPGGTVVEEGEMSEETSQVHQQAVADLAARLQVGEDEIETVSVESGMWSDGSIGCPEPGMVYTQALVPGHLVVLSYDGQTYSYHQGGAQEVFLCEEPAEGAFYGAEGDALIPPPGYDE